MKRYFISIGRKDNDLSKLIGTHYDEELADNGIYVHAADADATIRQQAEQIASLKAEVSASQLRERLLADKWNKENLELTAEVELLRGELDDMTEKASACSSTADQAIGRFDKVEDENAALRSRCEGYRKRLQSHGYSDKDIEAVDRQALADRADGGGEGG